MNVPMPPPKPPFNDPLAQAFSPFQQMLTQRQKVEAVMRKYGRELPKHRVPPATGQWEGDPNG